MRTPCHPYAQPPRPLIVHPFSRAAPHIDIRVARVIILSPFNCVDIDNMRVLSVAL